jgi:hypothetical protein
MDSAGHLYGNIKNILFRQQSRIAAKGQTKN